MNKTELLAEIATAKEAIKDYNKFKHLFSNDDAVKTIAKLNQTLGRIELGLKLSAMKEIVHPANEVLTKPVFGKRGALVKVKPVDAKYEGKTYLGFLIGELAMGSSITIADDKLQCNWAHHNPAIFVPQLAEVIMGCASWWSEIESEDDFKEITGSDIENTWYVKLWKQMHAEKELKTDQ